MTIWSERLDQIKLQFGLKSEFELAVMLSIHPTSLTHIRTGGRFPSVPNAVKILDKCGYALTRDVFLGLLHKTEKAAFIKAERKRALNLSSHRAEIEKWFNALIKQEHVDWIDMLNRLKVQSKLTTEASLAKLLEIPASTLAVVRSGKRQLPTAAKINVFTELGVPLSEESLLLSFPADLVDAVIATQHGLSQVLATDQYGNEQACANIGLAVGQ